MGKKVIKSYTYNDLNQKPVVISNYLTRAAQRLSLAEKRILFAGIARLGGVMGEVKLSAMEYAQTYDVEPQTAYTQLKVAADNLMKRSLSWQVNDGKSIGMLHCVWLQGYKYFQNEGYIRFKFSDYIFPFLFELEKEFTRYKLRQACALRSVHSWRLLELIEQFKQSDDSGWLQITIHDFWHAMEAKDSYKANFSLLRRWVIEPAVNELIHKDNWLIHWEPVKKGRKVSSLKFYFSKDPQGQLF